MESPDDCYAPADAAANLQFAWLGPKDSDVENHACRNFNIHLVEIEPPGFGWGMHQLEVLKACFGALLYYDRSISFAHAQICDYFFARDKREAMVYTWLPHECRFRLVDQDWVNLRRIKQ